MATEREISILIVDDEPASLNLTKEHLERSGFTVTAASFAQEALELARLRPFDSVISDYMMSGMDGIELLKALRAEENDVAFILFTGRGREEVVIDALNNGADFYLQKGFDTESTYAELAHKVQQAVRRYRAEEALRENEARYRSLSKNIEDRFQLYEVLRDDRGNVRDLKILDVNPAFERYVRRNAEELVGRLFGDVFPEADPTLLETIGAVEETGIPMKARRYNERTGQYHATLIFRPAEGQVGILCRDITEQVQSREDIERLADESNLRKAQLETIFKTLPVGVGISDVNGRVTELNDMINLIWRGKAPKPERVEDYKVYKAWWADSYKEIMPEDWGTYRALKNGEVSLGEVIRIQRFDGTIGTILHSSAPIVDGDGYIEGAIGVIQDITDKVVTEKALRESAEELRRSNAELQQFAYVASHDLKEPLRMVTSYLELLEKRSSGSLDDRSKEYLHFAVDGAKRMNDLINDLLAYSRVGTKGQVFSPVDMNEVTEIVLGDLKEVIEESGATVTHGRLPTVLADRTQMVQLLLNLIGNAIKFRGFEAPHVHISAEGKGVEWIFSVKDNGIGIPKDQHDRLFQMFQRLHTREEYEGTGIGLAICKKIVERHGGSIWVESEAGKGANFFFAMSQDRVA